MIEWIVGIFAVIAFLLGTFSAIIMWGQDNELEKYYRDTVVEAIIRPRYLPESIIEIPEEIIVDSGRKISPIRTYLKRKWAQIRFKEVPPVVLVFAKYSEEERKAFLIEKAFAASVESRLLDLDFVESLIHYLAYRCVYESEEVEEKVRVIIRKYFEGSEYRDCLVRLDSLDFSSGIVLNPPPQKKPLLTNVVLPMVREKEKKLLQTGAIIPEMEKWKALFMNVIKCMCSEDCVVLFIGARDDLEYIDMFEEGLMDCSHVIVSARGRSYITKMQRIIQICDLSEKQKPENEWVLAYYKSRKIFGLWEFPDEEKTSCHWIIFSKPNSS